MKQLLLSICLLLYLFSFTAISGEYPSIKKSTYLFLGDENFTYQLSDKNNGDLSKMKKYAQRRIDESTKLLKAKYDRKWIVSDNDPSLCLDRAPDRLLLLELALFASSGFDKYEKNKNLFEKTTVEVENSILALRKEISLELPNEDYSYWIAYYYSVDQAIKRFFYFNRDRLKKESPEVVSYIKSVLAMTECKNIIEAAKFYRSFIHSNGWPSRSEYGNSVPQYIFYALQHANHDPSLMKSVRDILGAFPKDPNSNVIAYMYADIADKISIYEQKQQEYGTFLQCVNGKYFPLNGVGDMKLLEEKRRRIGLRPLSVQLAKYSKKKCEG